MPRSNYFLNICCMFAFFITCQHIQCDSGRHSQDSMLLHLQLALVLSVCTCSLCIKTICQKEIFRDMRFNITCQCNDNIKVRDLFMIVLLIYSIVLLFVTGSDKSGAEHMIVEWVSNKRICFDTTTTIMHSLVACKL